jgi:hypothetical protein
VTETSRLPPPHTHIHTFHSTLNTQLNKALRRVSSGAVQSSSKDTRVPPPGVCAISDAHPPRSFSVPTLSQHTVGNAGEAAAGGVLRRFGSFARTASLNLGALARTASFTIGDSKETFVRAGADSAGARLLTRESTLSKVLLESSVCLPAFVSCVCVHACMRACVSVV